MIVTILLLICALALSGVAAFYSIVGLVAIFAGAPMSIIVMGSTLEVSKLVVASWLYRNWKSAPKAIKAYLSSALVILMIITSIGIFGYMSKAHVDQGIPLGNVVAQVEAIDQKIEVQKTLIATNKQTLQQLDQQVDQTLARTAGQTSDLAVARSVTIRRQQAKERATLAAATERAQAALAQLNTERQPIASQIRQVEAEVGPIKYIAALIYGDQTSALLIEKAVRYMIILIVTVFDPLAIMMLIAANWSWMKYSPNGNLRSDLPSNIRPINQPTNPATSAVEDSTIDTVDVPTFTTTWRSTKIETGPAPVADQAGQSETIVDSSEAAQTADVGVKSGPGEPPIPWRSRPPTVLTPE